MKIQRIDSDYFMYIKTFSNSSYLIVCCAKKLKGIENIFLLSEMKMF